MTRRQASLLLALLAAIAVGVNWTAYESHVANLGVQAMAHALSSARGEHSGIAEKRMQVEPLRGSTPPALKDAGGALSEINIVGSLKPFKGFKVSGCL